MRSNPIVNSTHTFFVCAMTTAVDSATRFHAVAYNPAAAMFTLGSERVDRAFEAIEVVRYTIYNDLDWFVVIVSADFTEVHN